MANKKGHYDSYCKWNIRNITTKFEKFIESLGIEIRIEHFQKSAL